MITLTAVISVLRRAKTEALELWLAFITILWGLYVLMPWVIFPSSIGLVLLGQYPISLIAICLGIIKVYLLVKSEAAANLAVFVGAVFWLFITVIYALDNVNTAPIVYCMFSLGNVWAYLRRIKVL